MLQDLGYTFDAGGNVTQLTDGLTTPGHSTQTFDYDDLDRLTQATGAYGTLTYSYNELGNLLSNSQVGTYTYPTSGSSSVRPHAVTQAGSETYTYDANGNLILGAGRIITYDVENRPDQVIQNGITTTFVYDGDGGRVQKTVTQGGSTTTTTYIGKLYVCEGTSCAKLIFAGNQRIAMMQVASGSTSYFHADHLGSTSVLTNGQGIQEQDVSYVPYGDTFSNSGTADVAYKYTGKEQDSSTGLYFYEARYYDPVLGRFISADTIVPSVTDPQALNRYSYARNNPIIFNDPTGHFFKKIFKGIKKGLKAAFKPVTASLNLIAKGLDSIGLGAISQFVVPAAAIIAGVYTAGATFKAYLSSVVGGLGPPTLGQFVTAKALAGFAGGGVAGLVSSGGDFQSGLTGAASGALGGAFAGLGSNPILAGAGTGAVRGAISGENVGKSNPYRCRWWSSAQCLVRKKCCKRFNRRRW